MTTRQAIAWEKLKNLEEYTIKHHTEEVTCEWCGFPMYVGEKVLYFDELPFCSHECITDYHYVTVRLNMRSL